MAKKKEKVEKDERFAIKLASIGVGGAVVLDQELLKCICNSLEGAASPDCKLEYVFDGIVAREVEIKTDLILYDLIIYSLEDDKRRKVFEANRGDYGRLYVNYMELTRKEAEELLERLTF